jgi:hypothetical protein
VISTRLFFVLGLLLLGFATVDVPESGAHCGSTPPAITLKIPNDTMSIQKVCLTGFGYCSIDTFYRSELLRTVTDNFKSNKHCVLAYIDSVHRYIILDSSVNDDGTVFYDTLQGENVWVSIFSNLKDSIPETHLNFNETIAYWPPNISQTTFMALIDTPFIAFFDTYGHMNQMGVGPQDGCFFESSAYFVMDGNIVARGDNRRRPGIKLPFSMFAQGVGLGDVPLPPIRNAKPPNPIPGVRLRYDGSHLFLSRGQGSGSGLEPYTVSLFDLAGRRLLHSGIETGRDYAADVSGYGSGMYWLRLTGSDWKRSRRMLLSGKTETSDSIAFPR